MAGSGPGRQAEHKVSQRPPRGVHAVILAGAGNRMFLATARARAGIAPIQAPRWQG
jgi:hypothetical protein